MKPPSSRRRTWPVGAAVSLDTPFVERERPLQSVSSVRLKPRYSAESGPVGDAICGFGSCAPSANVTDEDPGTISDQRHIAGVSSGRGGSCSLRNGTHSARRAASLPATTLAPLRPLLRLFGHASSNLSVAALGSMLIPQCRLRRGMPDTRHQLSECCSGLSRENCAGVPQVMNS